MVYLTRREQFNAAHRLFNPKWDDARNERVFGKCSNPNWHGHNYTVEVTIKGQPDPDTGFLFNASELSRIMWREALEKMDHRNLNLEVDFLKGVMPSTENLAKAIWKQLEPHLHDCELHQVRLYETEKNFADYYGE
jgi:6-pyruvoyltetrahydropterin/6-carboxytetrahydropterin synthase